MIGRSDPYFAVSSLIVSFGVCCFAVSSLIVSFGVCCFMHVTRIDTRSTIKEITRKKEETREEDINSEINSKGEAEN